MLSRPSACSCALEAASRAFSSLTWASRFFKCSIVFRTMWLRGGAQSESRLRKGQPRRAHHLYGRLDDVIISTEQPGVTDASRSKQTLRSSRRRFSKATWRWRLRSTLVSAAAAAPLDAASFVLLDSIAFGGRRFEDDFADGALPREGPISSRSPECTPEAPLIAPNP